MLPFAARIALPFLALALAAAPDALAQSNAAGAAPPSELGRTVVTFTVRGIVGTEAAAAVTSLPTELVARITRDPNLAVLHVEGIPERTFARAEIGFVFRDEASFHAWYEAPATRDLLGELERQLRDENVKLHLRRFPGAQYFDGAGN